MKAPRVSETRKRSSCLPLWCLSPYTGIDANERGRGELSLPFVLDHQRNPFTFLARSDRTGFSGEIPPSAPQWLPASLVRGTVNMRSSQE